MSLPQVGERFPRVQVADFDSQDLSGEMFLLIIWKIGCSTCRMSLPFFDRLATAYPQVRILGISQETEQELGPFLRTGGYTFENIPDPDLDATRRLGVEYVPAYWLVGPDGMVLEHANAWQTDTVEAISRKIAEALGVQSSVIVRTTDDVPALKPG